jgi:hypothetical protein
MRHREPRLEGDAVIEDGQLSPTSYYSDSSQLPRHGLAEGQCDSALSPIYSSSK